METKYTEKLSRVILVGIYLTVAFFLLKYFGSVVGYIVLAFVVSLIAKPLMGLLRKIKIKKKSIPDAVLTIISLLLIFSVLGGIVAGLFPVIKNLVTNITSVSTEANIGSVSFYLANFNELLRDTFHLAPDFKIEVVILDNLSSIFSFNLFGSVIGTVASTFAGIGIGLFSVIFISFFLIKDDTLVYRAIASITPDRHTEHMSGTLKDVEHLLSRYFVGLVIEMGCVGLISFTGLWAVARLDFESALGIGFLTGILNIIPYLGPVIGGVIGTLMGIVVKYCGPVSVGLDVSFWTFVVVLAAVFIVAQLVDNTILQPLIYSTSIKAGPLEIFLVMLVAGAIGGVLGMLLAIPAYTVVRVFAIHFYPDSKIVKALSNS